MNDRGTFATKYKADSPKVDPSSDPLFDPDPLISRAMADMKFMNKTTQYAANERRPQ